MKRFLILFYCVFSLRLLLASEPFSPSATVALYEFGPVEIGKYQDTPFYKHNGLTYIPAFRMISYGDTKLAWQIASGGNQGLAAWIEGPFKTAALADQTPIGAGPTLDVFRSEADGSLRFESTLTEKGVYRVVLGRVGWFQGISSPGSNDGFVFQTRCIQNCFRKEMGFNQLVQYLKSTGKLNLFFKVLEKQLLNSKLPEETRKNLLKQINHWIENPGLRFPRIPAPKVFSVFREFLLALLSPVTTAPDAVVQGDLLNLLQDCEIPLRTDDRPPLSPGLPEIKYDHFTEDALSNCQINTSRRLAKILTALSVGKGSWVTLTGENRSYFIQSPQELFKALIDTGHTIEVRNERTYGNFLALTIGEDTDARLPVWLDTGFALPKTGHLDIPIGHSQHTWRIWGPVVNSRVTAFLGIEGAGFFPSVDSRPAWTGNTARSVKRSGRELGTKSVLATVAIADKAVKRNRIEAKGLPMNGYGVVGVCHDFNAVIEKSVFETVSTFPLLRSSKWSQEHSLGDGLDEVVSLLPYDSDIDPKTMAKEEWRDYQIRALCRIKQMFPLNLEDLQWDPHLYRQMREILLADFCGEYV